MSQGDPTLYMIYMSVAAEDDEEFQRWNEEEHLAERLAVPGFLSVRRYRLAPEAGRGGAPADPNRRYHLTVYQVTNPTVLSSEAYVAATSTPTPWTLRMSPKLQVHLREVFVPEPAWRTRTGAETE